MKKFQAEDYVLMFILAVVGLMLLWLLVGCAGMTNKAKKVDMEYHNECTLTLEGMSIERAAKVNETWHINDCEIEVSKSRE